MTDIVGAVCQTISTTLDLLQVFIWGRERVGDLDSVEDLESAVLQVWETIRDANDWQLRGYQLSRSEKNLIHDLINECYHAEDLLEKPPRTGVRSMLPNPTSADNREISSASKNITSWLKALRVHLKSRSSQHQFNEIYHGERPYIVERQGQLEGRQDEMREIVRKLNSCDGNEKYGVCIVGMTGLGKSSIAHAILESSYHNPKIDGVLIDVEGRKFIWNEISNKIFMQYFFERVRKLASPILHILWKNNTPRMGVPELSTIEQHKQILLIVFDNVRSVDTWQWGRFQEYMIRQAEKSKEVRIMITTRDPLISERNCCLIPHELKLLETGACEQVIRGNARNGQLHDNVIKEAAKKCEGLPLVAEWVSTTISEHPYNFAGVARLSEVPQFVEEMFPRLMSAYIRIPAELSRCVAYLSLFPISHPYTIDDLVHLWEGECFVKPAEGLSSLKRIENYVKDLQDKLILQSSGKLNSFGLDYATLAAWGACQHGFPRNEDENENENERKYVRRLSMSCGDFKSQTWPRLTKYYTQLRTLLSLFPYGENAVVGSQKIPPNFCKKVKYLRVLSLKGTNIDEIPEVIEKLEYLRYFDISFTPVRDLPKALNNLQGLKFLKLKRTKIARWRGGFHKLKNLLHVDWDESMLKNSGMPEKIGKLSKLQNLPLFIVGKDKGYRIRQLARMSKLRGSIHIQGLENVKGFNEARAAMLCQKHDLKEIVLEWSSQSPSCETVLQGLELCNNVKKLELKRYVGEDFPDWILNSQLEEISLEDCNCPNLFRKLAKLQWLKILTVEYTRVRLAEGNCPCRSHYDTRNLFPSLELLELHNMTWLQRFDRLQEGDMPCFQRLKFVNCPQLDVSFFESLRNVEICRG